MSAASSNGCTIYISIAVVVLWCGVLTTALKDMKRRVTACDVEHNRLPESGDPERQKTMNETACINIVFDGPPGPVAGRFVEVENDAGESIRIGEWVQDGIYWRLRIPYDLPREGVKSD